MQLNLSYLHDLSGGDTDFIQDIISTYLEELPKDLQRIEVALNQEDVLQVGKLMHKMKSSFQILGFDQMHEEAFTLEQELKKASEISNSQSDRAKELIGNAQQSLDLVQNYLNS
ncbi:MAG: Hpt domain-containing protein [Saprospiraceae bacterium]|nr:Hpt domain-containing protein [Saprospiraceae bacterium]